jgi:hypothetical protein
MAFSLLWSAQASAAAPPEAPLTETCGGPVAPGTQQICGTLNPGTSAKVGYYFAYNTGPLCTGGGKTPTAEEVEGEDIAVSAELTGLEPNTQYAYCLVAENTNGTASGQAVTFTTPLPKPVVLGESASGQTRAGAQLSGLINPENGATFYKFEYGTTSGYGTSTAEALAGSGSGQVPAGPTTIAELLPGTTYHYRLLAGSASGITAGEDATFTTLALTPPLVSTGGASGISQVAATISATIDPQGLWSTYEFELGPTTGYGTKVFGIAGQGTVAETIAASIQFLTPGVTYHYRIQASNSDGAAYGADQTFTTPTFPLLTPALAVGNLSPSMATGNVRGVGSEIKVQRGGAAVKLTCKGTAMCRGKLTLTAKVGGKRMKTRSRTIGTATFSISAGKTATVKLELNAAGRELLRARHGRMSASLTILKSSPSPMQTKTEKVQLVQHGRPPLRHSTLFSGAKRGSR